MAKPGSFPLMPSRQWQRSAFVLGLPDEKYQQIADKEYELGASRMERRAAPMAPPIAPVRRRRSTAQGRVIQYDSQGRPFRSEMTMGPDYNLDAPVRGGAAPFVPTVENPASAAQIASAFDDVIPDMGETMEQAIARMNRMRGRSGAPVAPAVPQSLLDQMRQRAGLPPATLGGDAPMSPETVAGVQAAVGASPARQERMAMAGGVPATRFVDGEGYMPIDRPVYGAGARNLQESRVGTGMMSSGMTTGGAIGSGVMRGRMPTSMESPQQEVASRPMEYGVEVPPGQFAKRWKERFGKYSPPDPEGGPLLPIPVGMDYIEPVNLPPPPAPVGGPLMPFPVGGSGLAGAARTAAEGVGGVLSRVFGRARPAVRSAPGRSLPTPSPVAVPARPAIAGPTGMPAISGPPARLGLPAPATSGLPVSQIPNAATLNTPVPPVPMASDMTAGGYSPLMASAGMIAPMALGATPGMIRSAAGAASTAGGAMTRAASAAPTPVRSRVIGSSVTPTAPVTAPARSAVPAVAAVTPPAPVAPVGPGRLRRAAPYAAAGVGGAVVGGLMSGSEEPAAPIPPVGDGGDRLYYSRPYSRQPGPNGAPGGTTNSEIIAMNRARNEAAMARGAGTGKAPDYWQKAIPNREARRFFGRNPGALTDATLEAMRVSGGQNMRNDGAYEAYGMAVANEGLTRRQQMTDLMGQYNATEDPAQRAAIKSEYDAIASAPSSVQAPVMPQQPTYADVQRGIMGGGGRPTAPVPQPTIVNMPGGSAAGGQPAGPVPDESHMNRLIGDMDRSGDPQQQQIAQRYREAQRKLDAAQQKVTQLDRLRILQNILTLGIAPATDYVQGWLSGK